MKHVQVGERVEAMFYDMLVRGEVVQDNGQGIVWVKLDDGETKWFHKHSLKKERGV